MNQYDNVRDLEPAQALIITGDKIGPLYRFSEHGDLSFLLYVSKQCLEGTL